LPTPDIPVPPGAADEPEAADPPALPLLDEPCANAAAGAKINAAARAQRVAFIRMGFSLFSSIRPIKDKSSASRGFRAAGAVLVR
jgi:hypothetical protein